MDELLAKIEAAIAQRSDMKTAYPDHIGSCELRYSNLGWQAYAKVIGARKRRASDVFGTPCETAEEAANSLISALEFWGQAIAK